MAYDGLTPKDVGEKRLTVTRGGREGYDMEEVDNFLDEIERSLVLVFQANEETNGALEHTELSLNETRAEVKRLQDTINSSTSDSAGALEDVENMRNDALRMKADAEAKLEEARKAALNADGGHITVSTVPEASKAAARLLAHASQSVDAMTLEAEEEKERIIAEATGVANELLSKAELEANMLRDESEANAKQTAAELATFREETFGVLATEKSSLVASINNLKTFDETLRADLGVYLTQLQEQITVPLANDHPSLADVEGSGESFIKNPEPADLVQSADNDEKFDDQHNLDGSDSVVDNDVPFNIEEEPQKDELSNDNPSFVVDEDAPKN